MKERCLNKKHAHYKDYGGRGIKVCVRWRKFENFLADMGQRPSDEHQLDRKDNNGNYDPGNCRWATRVEQARNRRTNHTVAHAGKTMTLTEWCKEYGRPFDAVWHRINSGWSIEDALSRPLKKHRRAAA